jgi:cellulose synthase/poly-beta-1,6-N-acetylglucosamine synthase-like glycosyltransferase
VKTARPLSIVIPVYNGGTEFERCLDALLASDFHDYETLIVDDASTDRSAEAARARGFEILQLDRQSGPAAARNLGAAHTASSLILFLDADVVIRPDTLSRVVAAFASNPNVAAVFGSYDDAPGARGFVSQYRNLLHHFVHQQSSAEASTFWAGCGGIRREAFLAAGGFDERKYTRPSIEDIELGYRLRRRGFKILLDKELQVKHLKRWTLRAMLGTDILSRAVPWSKLILEKDAMVNDLNLRVSARVSGMLVLLSATLPVLSCFYAPFLAVLPLTLICLGMLNLPFLRFLQRRRGGMFALSAFGMLALYYFYSAGVFTLCYCAHVFSRMRALAYKARQSNRAGRVNNA